MNLLVTDDHAGEGAFPEFPKGAVVENIAPSGVPHWLACTINNMETFAPDIYIAAGRLIHAYNPTELVLAKGSIVELRNIVYEWLYVTTKTGDSGWLPASKALSLPQ